MALQPRGFNVLFVVAAIAGGRSRSRHHLLAVSWVVSGLVVSHT